MASAPDHHHRHDQSASPAAAALDPATESLSSALRSGFNVLRLIMIVLLVAYFFSGWVSIGPGQQGVIIRFGELRTNPASAEEPAVFDQGWYAALPDPFDEKIILSGEQRSLTVDTFLFARPPAEQGKPLEAAPARDDIDPAVDGSMMTGDRGLVHGRWAIGYVIADAEQPTPSSSSGTSATTRRPLRFCSGGCSRRRSYGRSRASRPSACSRPARPTRARCSPKR